MTSDTTARHEFHSPLTLLYEWADNIGAPLREVLITGYTLDLTFLEQRCLSTARALGARVTILSDAGQASHEPVDVRHAGRAYQHAHAHCAGAFHPKLVILLGDDHLWVAIGSGNPTLSGWGHNHELWLIIRTTPGHGPAAMGDLADWLADLPHVVSVPSWIAHTLTEISHAVRPAPNLPGNDNDELPDLRIIGNLRRSILDQLSDRPVDGLRLSAPFFDPHGRAVRELATRMHPGRIDIAVQPTWSSYNGEALVDATSGVPDVAFRFVDEDRTCHGKLVEWSRGDATTALVGSANLSVAAILTATRHGGNCELVATAPPSGSLLPEGTATPPAALRTHNTISERLTGTGQPILTVLGGRRMPDGAVVVEFITSIAQPVTIETSPHGAPDTWLAVHRHTEHAEHMTDTGHTTITARFHAPGAAGSVLRACATVNGTRVVSAPVFITDTQRCLPRPDTADTPKLVRDYALDDVITDPELQKRFSADLLRLLAESQASPKVAALRTTGAVTSNAAAPTTDRWGAWLASVERTLGPSLTSLLFPGAVLVHGIDSATVPLGWSVGPDTDETELVDGETDDTVDDLLATTTNAVTARTIVIPPTQQQHWRTTASKLCHTVQVQPAPPLLLRMTVARVYLDLLAAGIWATEQNWRGELHRILTALVASESAEADLPGQTESFLASLVAVCLALLTRDASLHGGSERDLIAQKAWNTAKEWAAFADPELVEGCLRQPAQPYAQVATATEVKAVIDLATDAADDPHAELRATLTQEGIPATLINGVWVIDNDHRNPRRQAARVATLAAPRCAVLVRTSTTNTVILRDGPVLALGESSPPLWRIYRLSPLSTPTSLLSDEDGLPRAGTTRPLQPAPPSVISLAESVGVDIKQLGAALAASGSGC
jgi:hypothetical protein